MEKGINILYLYPDMLELYGDYGNIQVLKYRLEKRGFYCNIEKYSIGNPAPDFSSFDSAYDTFFYLYGFELLKEYAPYKELEK